MGEEKNIGILLTWEKIHTLVAEYKALKLVISVIRKYVGGCIERWQ